MDYNESKAKSIKIDYSPISCNSNIDTMLSKIENARSAIKQLRPFEDIDMLAQIKSFYKTDCVWSSEALEGNSITKGETQVIIEEGVTVDGHPLNDILRTAGHAEAFDEIFNMIHQQSFSIDDIVKLHNIIMRKEKPDLAGKFKQIPNFITGSDYKTISPRQIPSEMNKFDNWLADRYGKDNIVLFAAEIHRKLVYIHPFTDGNGRTARLAMNAVLIQNGYLPISISPYMKRDYNSALELGRQGNVDAFYEFITEAEYETEKDFCRYMDIDITASQQKKTSQRTSQTSEEIKDMISPTESPDDTPLYNL